MSVLQILRKLLANPGGELVRRWNWKSALLSSLCRGLIFFFANLSAGLHAATGALVAEWCYRALTSGFYGALTQALSDAEPAWASTLVALIVLPLGSHSLEFAVHSMRHTPKLATSIVASVSYTVISTLFHLHAMRRGAFVVRAGASSLLEDMSRVPYLIATFVASGPLLLWRASRKLAHYLLLRHRTAVVTGRLENATQDGESISVI